MPLVTGFDWALSSTTEFGASVEFIRSVLGLPIVKQGIPRHDPHFSRYALAVLPSGRTLAAVEPKAFASNLAGRQILRLNVRSIVAAIRALDERGASFISDMHTNDRGLGWIYLGAPGGNAYQICGPTGGDDCATAKATTTAGLIAGLIADFDWMLSCTNEFDASTTFLRDVLGLPITSEGTAQNDLQFARYACVSMPQSGTVEVVEPTEAAVLLRGRQVLCFVVDDIAVAVRHLEERGATFVSDLIAGRDDLAWIYVRAKDGNVYQFYGR
jgi:catechol 2,3-dioxygenase-like lactoylglutathione lyase family enzyme